MLTRESYITNGRATAMKCSIGVAAKSKKLSAPSVVAEVSYNTMNDWCNSMFKRSVDAAYVSAEDT